MTPCIRSDDLVRFVDGALTVEQSVRVSAHVATCPRCRDDDRALRALASDIRELAPVNIDARAHARSVMERLDRPAPPAAVRRPFWIPAMAVAAAAACALYLHFGSGASSSLGTWQARGGASVESTVARDVGVQPYAVLEGRDLRPLASGATIEVDTPLTAGFRNLGRVPVFLLFFAVDKEGVVHWISPPYERPGDDPGATLLVSSVEERTLGTTAVLADVPPGPVRLVAVLTPRPAHVSDIEVLERRDLDAPHLVRRLPGAEVRETVIEMKSADRRGP
jgi:hypothetical protein